ncbi:MAG: peptide deformylase [Candidatus Omnitrophota bacterium]|jgi:peptide deformylase
MKPLEINRYPNYILRKKCALVEKVTEDDLRLFNEMLFTIHHFGGMGLAAPEIGMDKSLIVVDIKGNVLKMANPEILDKRGFVRFQESCLSLPGLNVRIGRADKIVVRGLNEKGKIVEFRAEGLLSRVLQHEIDHLKGRLIIDYLGLLERVRLFKTQFIKPEFGHICL